MTTRETQIVDSAARVVLPKGFAKATVTLEEISESEVRIRKTGESAQEPEFAEETITALSDRDRNLSCKTHRGPAVPESRTAGRNQRVPEAAWLISASSRSTRQSANAPLSIAAGRH